ncbi:MAG: hypothetical protein ABI321_03940 [Polyangia bacterium]
MMRMHNNPSAPRFRDPMARTHSAGQSLYKSNLLGTVKLFRAQAGLSPLGWPS